VTHKLLALFAFALIAGCDDEGTAPALFVEPDSYALVRVAGQPMPATIIIGDNTSIEIVGDTMRFGTDGRGTQIFVSRQTFPNQPPGDPVREERTFQYRKTGNVLEIDFPCPDLGAGNTASCIAPPHYRGSVINSIQISFDLALNYPTPMLFQRLGIPE
jgi:hypothetical protein